MRYLSFLLFIGISFFSCNSTNQKKAQNLTSYVNPFIGTDGPGNTYPGATLPFGMVQLSPDIGIPGWDRIAGYYYKDSIISGFSHTHLTGTGAGDLYDILVMPTNSKFSKRIEANKYMPYSSFSHSKEKASPGYYSVELLDYKIKAELTATNRVGIHRYTFPKDDKTEINIDLGYSLNWDKPTKTFIEVVNDSTIQGYRFSTGWAKDQRVYFVMQFSKPFNSYKLFENKKKINAPEKGKGSKIVLQYKTEENDQLVIKTGLSTASVEGAKQSIEKETTNFDFDFYKEKAQLVWEKELEKIEIETKDKNKKTVFYTMLYQSMLAPTILSDWNGEYKGANDTIELAKDYVRYDTFSLWDTYRAAHPLYTIIHPNKIPDFIKSMLAHYKETGLLPVWSLQGNETNMMIGYHAVPVIVDAYFKGFHSDKEQAYEACKKSAMVADRQIDLYMKNGYIPTGDDHENWSVSKTLEYAYDDWCIAMFAQDLGYNEDYEYFLKRSENWKNLFNKNNYWIQPKLPNGEFIKPFEAKEYSPYFCESNAWHYYWSVPQNIDELINFTGGKQKFTKKLDSMFTYTPLNTEKLPIFSTGMIGQYAHGNEPSHHVAYLYNYVNKPFKTQELVLEILNNQYKNKPDGHCGNEDCGQMSSWYILSSLGFYPVNPAQGSYIIGVPQFSSATIKLPKGKEFKVLATTISDKNCYIKSMKLNNEELKSLFITHSQIVNGGVLEFEMTDDPSKSLLNGYSLPEANKIYK